MEECPAGLRQILMKNIWSFWHQSNWVDPRTCTGLSTAAHMENAAIECMKYEDFTVTAIVTAGINVNAVRVGDPTTWHERAGTYFEVMSGTIIFYFIWC